MNIGDEFESLAPSYEAEDLDSVFDLAPLYYSSPFLYLALLYLALPV